MEAFFHLHDEDVAPFGFVGLHVVAYLGAAIQPGCGFYHVLLFIGADAGYFPVVFYADKQPSSLGIGKGGKGFGNLARIGYFKLEVLLLMLAFGNEVVYVGSVVRLWFHGCKSRLKNASNVPFKAIFTHLCKKYLVFICLFQERVYFCPAIINQINQ